MLQDPTCDRCKGIHEWVGHALFTCPCVQDAWCAVSCSLLPPSNDIQLQDLLWHLGEGDDLEILECIVILAWVIWTDRNRV